MQEVRHAGEWSLRDGRLERCPSKYVAIDMTTDEVVLAADTHQELEAEIRGQGWRPADCMRHPAGPITPVGLGFHGESFIDEASNQII